MDVIIKTTNTIKVTTTPNTQRLVITTSYNLLTTEILPTTLMV